MSEVFFGGLIMCLVLFGGAYLLHRRDLLNVNREQLGELLTRLVAKVARKQ